MQARWKTLVRLVIALPSLFVAAALGGAGGGASRGTARSSNSAGFQSSGVSSVTSFLGWCVCVVKGQMPKGFRDTGGFVVGYWAQILAYLLLVTDRYPNADPTAMLSLGRAASGSLGPRRRRLRGSADVARDRVLPAAARDPAPLLARALERARGSRLDRAVARHADPRPADRRVPPLPLALDPLRLPRLRLRRARREPVPVVRRAVRSLPPRPRAPAARPPEPVEDALPRAARDPGVPRQLRAERRARGQRDPDLVRRVGHRTRSRGAAEPVRLRAAVRGADERVHVLLDRPVSAREPTRGRRSGAGAGAAQPAPWSAPTPWSAPAPAAEPGPGTENGGTEPA